MNIKKSMQYTQYGRSMIEMLGVLAIIGVLSVGGIAGYSKAMHRYRINKFIDQVTLTVGNETSGTKEVLYMESFSCDNDVFANKDECRKFFYDMRLQRIYISRFDLSYVYTCDSHESDPKCMAYNFLDQQTKLYLKSLPYVPAPENAPTTGGYYIIFEFIEDEAGGVCSNDNCMREYASIKYGGTNTIINLR